MRRQKGFTLIELLIVIVIIGIIAAIAIPSFVRARRASLVYDRQQSFLETFGVTIPVTDVGTPLTDTQKDILRPLVTRRVDALCNADDGQPSADPVVVQRRLDNATEGACAKARAVAQREGILPAEKE